MNASTTTLARTCPTREQLREVALGIATPQQVERIALHLVCSPACDCHATLATFDQDQDALLAILKEPRAMRTGDDEDAWRSLAEKAIPVNHGGAAAVESTEQPPPLVASMGPYRDLKLLNRGGMGDVFRAFDERLNRPVALKIIRQDRLATDSSVTRFRAEAETVARLDHPNIVPIYEVSVEGEHHYIAMKLIEGQTLAQLIEPRKRDLRSAVELVATVARAIHYAHQRQVLHRDLKPSNVLVDDSGIAYVTDFGLAKRLDIDASLTQTGAILGTPSYMAPEQAVGNDDEITTVTDVYGLGGVLYYALTARPPVEGRQPIEVLRRVVDQLPVPPSRWNHKVDHDLDTICLKCLDKDPTRRYGSADALARDLERWLLGEPIRARPVSWPRRVGRWCRRRPLTASLLAIVAVLALIVAIGSPLATLAIRQRAIETQHNLFTSQLALARAERRSKLPDHRRAGLAAMKGALQARQAADLSAAQRLAARNEAIAALAFPQVACTRTWPIPSPYPGFDRSLSHYAYCTPTGQLVVQRTDDNAEVARFAGLGRTDHVIQISPTSEFLAVPYENSQATGLALFSVPQGDLVWFQEMPSRGMQVSFSPDGNQIAVSGAEPSIRVFDTRTGQPRVEIQRPQLPRDERAGFAWTSNSRGITFADRTHVVRNFDLGTEQIETEVQFADHIMGVSWRPDGQMLAAHSWDELYLWDVSQERIVRTYREHRPGPIVLTSFGPDGRLLASATHVATHVWHVATGHLVARLPGRYPQFSQSSRKIGLVDLLDGSFTASIWQFELPREFVSFAVHDTHRGAPLQEMAIAPDGSRLAATSAEGLFTWELPSMRFTQFVPLPRAYGVAALPSPGAWLVNCQRGLMKLQSTSSSAETTVTELLATQGGDRYRQLSVSADGNQVAMAADRSAAILLDRESDASQSIELQHDESTIAVSPDGKLVVTLVDREVDLEVLLWDFATAERLTSLGTVARGYSRIAFSPDSRRLVIGTRLQFHGWEQTSPGTWRPSFTIPRDAIGSWSAAAFSGDGRMLAIADTQQTVKLVDAMSGAELCRLLGPEPRPAISDLCFGSDDRKLYVAGANLLVQAWDLGLIRSQLRELGLDW